MEGASMNETDLYLLEPVSDFSDQSSAPRQIWRKIVISETNATAARNQAADWVASHLSEGNPQQESEAVRNERLYRVSRLPDIAKTAFDISDGKCRVITAERLS